MTAPLPRLVLLILHRIIPSRFPAFQLVICFFDVLHVLKYSVPTSLDGRKRPPIQSQSPTYPLPHARRAPRQSFLLYFLLTSYNLLTHYALTLIDFTR
jgi:hypothetical protein